MRPNLKSWCLTLSLALAAAIVAGCGGGGEEADGPAPRAAEAEAQDNARSAPIPRPQAAQAALALNANSLGDGARQRALAAAKVRTNKVYIVQMADKPVAAAPTTRPAKGNKIDRRSAAVVSYSAQLRARHDAVARSVNARKLYSYSYAFNGFSAELSDDQVNRLRATKGVLAVTKDRLLKTNTATTPAFLGLTGASGFYNRTNARGENVVIGVIDSGVWPEHLSFSNKADAQGNYAAAQETSGYGPVAGWTGSCNAGITCNGKLVGAKHYNAAWGGDEGLAAEFSYEFLSARDHNGHGSHTASTAGGNANVPVTGQVAVFGATMSGIAPRARIAAYKVCWDDGASGSCFSSDSMAAIDEAVADGVDVINFSVSGSTDVFLDPVEIAFMYAADAGVFVAASAGNDGPAASTVAHPSPWITTVAAGTHNRSALAAVTLGNAASYTGASVNLTNVAATALIDASAAGVDGAASDKVAQCWAAKDNGNVAVLDPAKVAGKIVVCNRGFTDRVNKSLAVLEAGGVGMILVNPTPNSLNNDFHSVPTVHLQNTHYDAIHAYAATISPTAAITPTTISVNAPAPFQSDFSSRGPTFAANSDLLKPDITAPGTDIIAAVAPPGNSDRLFDLYSGTSMSSPHIAGIAALFKQVYPAWSPMMIKSALMTTAGDVMGDSNTSASHIFSQGAGHVRPMNALDPGLVFDSNFAEWLGMLCTTELDPSFCTSEGIPLVQARNVNVASIAVANVAGVQTATRRVRNVTDTTTTYKPKVTGMAGFKVTVSPSTLRIRPGMQAKFTVKFERDGSAYDASSGGQLTWSDGVHDVRVPLIARAVKLNVPEEVAGTFPVSFGYTGSFSATPRGMVPALKQPHTISTNAIRWFEVVVPAGTEYTRFQLFNSDVSLNSDLDLAVFKGDDMIGYSGGLTADERLNFRNLTPGTYDVAVVGYYVPGTASFNLYSWSVGTASTGGMTANAPVQAVSGTQAKVVLSMCTPTDRKQRSCTLPAGNKYMGLVEYSGTSALPQPTVVFVE